MPSELLRSPDYQGCTIKVQVLRVNTSLYLVYYRLIIHENKKGNFKNMLIIRFITRLDKVEPYGNISWREFLLGNGRKY